YSYECFTHVLTESNNVEYKFHLFDFRLTFSSLHLWYGNIQYLEIVKRVLLLPLGCWLSDDGLNDCLRGCTLYT
ncbi:hypothetical protein DOY81_004281, partial [Sarcophaga bullata]